LLEEQVGTVSEMPDTGDVVADLKTQMTAVAELFNADFRPVLQGTDRRGTGDAAVAQGLASSSRSARGPRRDRLSKAQQQGQIRATSTSPPPWRCLRALYYRLLVGAAAPDSAQVSAVLDVALHGSHRPLATARHWSDRTPPSATLSGTLTRHRQTTARAGTVAPMHPTAQPGPNRDPIRGSRRDARAPGRLRRDPLPRVLLDREDAAELAKLLTSSATAGRPDATVLGASWRRFVGTGHDSTSSRPTWAVHSDPRLAQPRHTEPPHTLLRRRTPPRRCAAPESV